MLGEVSVVVADACRADAAMHATLASNTATSHHKTTAAIPSPLTICVAWQRPTRTGTLAVPRPCPSVRPRCFLPGATAVASWGLDCLLVAARSPEPLRGLRHLLVERRRTCRPEMLSGKLGSVHREAMCLLCAIVCYSNWTTMTATRPRSLHNQPRLLRPLPRLKPRQLRLPAGPNFENHVTPVMADLILLAVADEYETKLIGCV
jgi:hypothetical protein